VGAPKQEAFIVFRMTGVEWWGNAKVGAKGTPEKDSPRGGYTTKKIIKLSNNYSWETLQDETTKET